MKVSEKHSNFLVASKEPKSKSLYKLVKFVKEEVHNKYGVLLNEEIIFIGDFLD